jgi:serine/threonine protein kinase
MGEVYLAEDLRLERKIALKFLPRNYTQDRERVQRFQQEARAASALNHPNILTVYEIGVFEGRHFIATEFIDGQTLRQQMVSGQVKLGVVLEVAIQVASALAAAHEAGVVHRDIKPENLMLRRDGIVKVLDFGLAKLTEQFSAEQSSIADGDAPTRGQINTDPGKMMGTARYMSPEQIQGREVDGRTDIFSLGVVLYEMVAGRAPFEGATAGEVIAAILNQEPPPLERYSREVPAELERMVTKALQKDREKRYKTVEDLLIDLKSLKLELEIEAKLKRASQSGVQDETEELRLITPPSASTFTTNVGPMRPPAQPDTLSPSVTQDETVPFVLPRARVAWAMSIAVGIVLLFLSGVLAYRFWNPARAGGEDPTMLAEKGIASPGSSMSAKPVRVEVMRYYLEMESADDKPARVMGVEPLTAGQAFKFHFTPRERGYLYIIASGERNVPTTFLTARPIPASGVTTNRIEAGADYSFPAGEGNGIVVGRYGNITTFTIILSPTPLATPGFLAARANRQLTAAEQQELEAFWQQFGKDAPELVPETDGHQAGVAVTVPADRASGQPIIFDIPIKRR